jgi:hypothetical protein
MTNFNRSRKILKGPKHISNWYFHDILISKFDRHNATMQMQQEIQ